jgi:hypothetical protein
MSGDDNDQRTEMDNQQKPAPEEGKALQNQTGNKVMWWQLREYDGDTDCAGHDDLRLVDADGDNDDTISIP